MTWLYLASGLWCTFMGFSVSLWCGSIIQGKPQTDTGISFLLAVALHLISATLLFSAGIAWVQP